MRQKILSIISFILLFTSICTSGCTIGETEQDKQNSRDKDNNKGVPHISVRDFMRHSDRTGYTLSPDGNFVAYLAPWRNRLNVYVQNMKEKGKPVRVTSSTDRDIAEFSWKDNFILYRKDKGGNESFHIYSAAFNGQQEKDLTPYPDAQANIVSKLSKDRDHILISMNKENAKLFHVYKLNLKSGQIKLVVKSPGNIIGYMPDREGKILLALAFDGTVLSRNTEKEKFRTFLTSTYFGEVMPLELFRDEQKFYAISSKDRDKAALVTFDRQGKEKLLYAHPDVDVGMISNRGWEGSIFDHRNNLLAVAFTTDKLHYKFFDASYKALFQKLQHKLNVSESELSATSFNEDLTKFIVVVSNDKIRGRHYYYDSTLDQLTFLSDASSWLKPEHMANMQPISYRSRDGLTIHGYVTLPKNRTPKQLPLVVNPHGGPWERDFWGFNEEVQLLANRGYAVLQMNFRASTGYGKAFMDAGDKEWGGKIQHDITDGVQWAIKKGIADPERIAIYGRSFGGYAALAGITFEPHLYAAAVDYVGVSNIFTRLATVALDWEGFRNEAYKRIGHPEKDKALLTKVSPLFHVDKIVTPLFVAHGANDPFVKKTDSDQIVNALRKRGVEVQYMRKENEGHGFRNVENRIEFYEAMIAFLDKHLKK